MTRSISRTPTAPEFGDHRFEVLEDRFAPAATAALVGPTLVVTADDADARLSVTTDPGTNQILVRNLGVEIGRFDAAGVTGLAITTGAGNDRIDVTDSVTALTTIDAGGGKNVVNTGGGLSTVQGGSGVDKFAGQSGAVNFFGGGGVDQLRASASTSTLNGEAGADRIFPKKPSDVVIFDPLDTVNPFPDEAAALAAQLALLARPQETLTADEVRLLLDRASAASASRDAIIAITDRNGRILGVRVEDGVAVEITGNTDKLVFAIDGALAKARTASYFGTDPAPLTSRIRAFLSHTTITEREVNSDPSITDPNSTLRGPGFVAAVGVGGHFPPGIANTPAADIFGIEHTNRDQSFNPGPDRIMGTADDIQLPPGRFNIDPNFVPPGQTLFPPNSYGVQSGIRPRATNRGLGTLPGGLPIIKNGQAVGAIGVFFPGKTGYATEENSVLGTTYDPTKPDRNLESEYIAFAALGGDTNFPSNGPIGNAPALPAGFGPFPGGARVDLVGITLNIFGPGGTEGPTNLAKAGLTYGVGLVNGNDQPVLFNGGVPVFYDAGLPVPEGWIVVPHDGDGITKEQVEDVLLRAIVQSTKTRSAVRPDGSFARLILSVTDRSGNVVGLYRFPDATNDALNVTVQKARNVMYYADPNQLQPQDRIPGIPAGTAFTGRTFRYVAQPRFPIGIDGTPPAPWSILNDGGVDPLTGRQVGAPLPASAFQTPFGYDAFNPNTNFRQQAYLQNQNGVSFFPAGVPLYDQVTGQLIGGFGTSGDGVDQNDIVAFAGSVNFGVPNALLRADEVLLNGVRLPYQKFGRNPQAAVQPT